TRSTTLRRSSEATRCSQHEPNAVDFGAAVESVGAECEQHLERMIAVSVAAESDAERLTQEAEIEAAEVLAEHVAQRVVHRAVEPKPDRPLVFEDGCSGAPVDQPPFQKSTQRTCPAQRDLFGKRYFPAPAQRIGEVAYQRQAEHALLAGEIDVAAERRAV